jgi:hypothetical protein
MARPARNFDLHGSAPEKSPVALLLIDVINDFDFPDGRALLRSARAIVRRVAALKARAAGVGIPAIYVNDNLGRWRSDFRQLVQHCARATRTCATSICTFRAIVWPLSTSDTTARRCATSSECCTRIPVLRISSICPAW